MNKPRSGLHAVLAALLVLLGSLAAPAQAAQVLKIATIAPEGSGWMREMRACAAALKERTEGRVELKFYPGGVMGNDVAVLRKMKLGQLQGGAFAGAELSGVYADAQIYSLPFLFRDQGEVDHVRSKVDAEFRAGFEPTGLVALGFAGAGFAYLMGTRPLGSREELIATKVWAPQADVYAQVTFQAGGIQPIVLPITDVYPSLTTGLIETVGNTPSGTIAFQWHTRIKHLVDFPLTYVMGIVAVDKKAFDRLDPADQAIAREVVDAGMARLDAATRKDNEGAFVALEKQGIAFFRPDARERQFWISIGEKARETLAERGAFSPGLYAKIQAALAEYRAAHPAAAGATP